MYDYLVSAMQESGTQSEVATWVATGAMMLLGWAVASVSGFMRKGLVAWYNMPLPSLGDQARAMLTKLSGPAGWISHGDGLKGYGFTLTGSGLVWVDVTSRCLSLNWIEKRRIGTAVASVRDMVVQAELTEKAELERHALGLDVLVPLRDTSKLSGGLKRL